MKKVLVVGVGNSSRSQMAEGYLNFFAGHKAQVFSAGLIDRGLDPLAIEVMSEDNIDISENNSKTWKLFRRNRFDYVISVSEEASIELPRQLTSGTTRLLHFPIPDPAKSIGDDPEKLAEFRRVRESVKKFILKFIGQELSEEEPVSRLI